VSSTEAAPRTWALLGMRLVAIGEGSATIEMTPTEDMTNHSGFVHGGMISTLADSAMGKAVRANGPKIRRQVSFDLKVTFISTAKVGETLQATGRVIHAGRRTVVAECRVEGPGQRLVATASGTFAVTREKE